MSRKRFTSAEDADLLRMRDGDRLGFSAIGRAQGRAPTTCSTRYNLLRQRAADARPTTTRACMTCRAPFQSQGAHNRMCDPCRDLGSGCPLEPDDYATPLHATGRRLDPRVSGFADRETN